MKNDYMTYDPTDIESMLMHKGFDELNEAEKKFAIEQLGSPSGYEEMRVTLLSVMHTFREEESIEAAPSVKASLMDQFARQHAAPATETAWEKLKRTLFPAQKNFFFSPGFQIAAIALLMGGISLMLINSKFDAKNGSDSSLAIVDGKDEVSTDTVAPTALEESTITEEGENVPTEEITSGSASIIVDEKKAEVSGFMQNMQEINKIALAENAKTEDIVLRDADYERNVVALDSASTIFAGNAANYMSEVEPDLKAVALAKEEENVNRKKDADKTVMFDDNSTITNKSKYKGDDKRSNAGEVMLNQSVATETLKKNERAETKAPGKEAPGVSLEEKPELIEFLFTAL